MARGRLAVLTRIDVGPGRLNFQRLQDCGGEVLPIPAGDDRDPIVHHKLCVIDRATVIVGPYNWTKRAQANDESITFIAAGDDCASGNSGARSSSAISRTCGGCGPRGSPAVPAV